jgi:capsular exopolysaccharide synthesis family protein
MNHLDEGKTASEDGPRGRGGNSQNEVALFLWTLRKWWWLLALGGLIVAGVVWYGMSQRTPVYTSEVLLREMNEPSTLEVALSSSQQGGQSRGMDFGSLRELIRSRTVASKVVDSLGLQLEFENHASRQSELVADFEASPDADGGRYLLLPDGGRAVLAELETRRPLAEAGEDGWIDAPGFRIRIADAGGLPTEEPVRIRVRRHERAVERLQNQTSVEPGKGTGLINIRYSHPDARISANVVNAVAEEFMRFRTSYAKSMAAQRRKVLADQLVQLSDSLRETEEKFLAYQQEAGLLNPETQGGALTTELTTAENRMRELRSDRAMLRSLVASLESEAGGAGGVDNLRRISAVARELVPGGESLYDRLESLYTERRELTASRFGYTESGSKVQVIDSLIAGARNQLNVLTEEALNLTEERLADAEERVGELRAELGASPQRTARFDRLKQRVDAVQNVFDVLTGKYYEAQVAEGVESGNMELIDTALVPRHPDPLHRNRNVALGFMFGVLLAGTGVGFMHYLNDEIASLEDVERITGVTVVGSIPHFDDADTTERWEAFQALATNHRLSPESGAGVLAITSSAPGEGKSTVAANLALVLAQDDRRVLLVDTDLRRPVQHKVFGVDRQPGLTDVVTGSATLEEAITETLGLHVLPCGKSVPNPPALMRNVRVANLLEYMRKEVDVIILDTSPVLAVADSSIACSLADAVYLVVAANRTDRSALTRTLEQLRAVGAEPAGTILSRIPSGGKYGESQYHYYKYPSYYGSEPSASSERHEERLQVVTPPALGDGPSWIKGKKGKEADTASGSHDG